MHPFHDPRRNERRADLFDRAFWALLLAALAAVLAVFRDFGYSWDELWQTRWLGQSVLSFLTSFGKDTSALSEQAEFFHFDRYSSLYNVLVELFVRLRLWNERDTLHLANALTGLLGVWGCRELAKRVGGPLAGFLAAAFLLSMAPYHGHLFINPKDIPFATAHVWALYFLLRWFEETPAPSLRVRLGFGISLGAALGVRMGGVCLLVYLAGLLAAALWKNPGGKQGYRERIKEALSPLAMPLALAYALMIVCWPSALLHPLETPWSTLTDIAPTGGGPGILWAGQVYSLGQLPWSYLPTLLAVELPEALALLLAACLPWACWAAWKAHKTGDSRRGAGLWLLVAAALFPVTTAIASGAALYDNMRHFLFILPPLACLAGLGCAAALERLGENPLRRRVASLALAACLLGPSLWNAAALHPYEYAYKNRFAGGMPAAARLFETDYWLTSYREATRMMVDHARSVARAEGTAFEQREFVASVVFMPLNVAAEAPENFTIIPEEERGDADYLIASTRYGMADAARPDWPVIGRVQRLGMTFAVVKASPNMQGTSGSNMPETGGLQK